MINCFQKSVHIVQENMLILHIFCHAIQQNINKKITHVYHANLEKIIYKTVTWVISYKYYN